MQRFPHFSSQSFCKMITFPMALTFKECRVFLDPSIKRIAVE